METEGDPAEWPLSKHLEMLAVAAKMGALGTEPRTTLKEIAETLKLCAEMARLQEAMERTAQEAVDAAILRASRTDGRAN